jgi:hypothetical protein
MRQSADGAAVGIEYFHQAAHDRELFEIYYENLNMPLTAIDFLVKTGALPVHALFAIEATGKTNAKMYRAPTTSADGTAVELNPFNEVKAKTLELRAYSTPTVTATGADIRYDKTVFGSTNGVNRVISAVSPGVERILLPNTNYLIRIVTTDAASWLRMQALVYEENV